MAISLMGSLLESLCDQLGQQNRLQQRRAPTCLDESDRLEAIVSPGGQSRIQNPR
jgi:hypothetical protein